MIRRAAKKTIPYFLVFSFAVIVIGLQSGCAILGVGEDDAAVKSFSYKSNAPEKPFQKINMSTADAVWQSDKTGNTIAVNSLCRKYQEVSLEHLKENILSGIDDLKIEQSQTTTFDGRDAERVTVSGKTDGIPVSVSVLTYKKNGCTYDLAYIARANNFDKEVSYFEKFLTGFHVP